MRAAITSAASTSCCREYSKPIELQIRIYGKLLQKTTCRGLGGRHREHSASLAGRLCLRSAGRRSLGALYALHSRGLGQHRRVVRHSSGDTLRRKQVAGTSAQRPSGVVRGGLRRGAAGAVGGQDRYDQVLRFRGRLLLGHIRPYHPQLLPYTRVVEAGDSGRVLHQDRRGVPRRDDSVPRRDEVGQRRSGAGVDRGLHSVVLRLFHCAQVEGRPCDGDDAFERRVDMRRVGLYHGCACCRYRRPQVVVYSLGRSDHRRADDLSYAVACRDGHPSHNVRSRRAAGDSRCMDRRYDRYHQRCGRLVGDGFQRSWRSGQ